MKGGLGELQCTGTAAVPLRKCFRHQEDVILQTFESTPNHHCCQDGGLSVTAPSANLLPCEGTNLILFCCFFAL